MTTDRVGVLDSGLRLRVLDNHELLLQLGHLLHNLPYSILKYSVRRSLNRLLSSNCRCLNWRDCLDVLIPHGIIRVRVLVCIVLSSGS
jgi:hypothetical protein